MAFVWVEGTAVGDIIHKADIDEIHTNIDSVKDSLANITHYVTDNSNEKGTHNATKYTTHDATQYTGRDSAHYTSNNSGNNGTYYSDLNSTIETNNYDPYDNSRDYIAFGGANSSVNSTYNSSQV